MSEVQKIKPKDKPHYVNNRDFSQAVLEYVQSCEQAAEEGRDVPIVTNYIADCFLKIAEGLSHKSNFVRYTYREEMVMDAVENCLKAIKNYDIEAATRTGKPNAFAYFTQISWFAFLRRIQKEKKQQDVKIKYMMETGYEEYIAENGGGDQSTAALVDSLKDRIDKVKSSDQEAETITKEVTRRKRKTSADSDLTDFIGWQ